MDSTQIVAWWGAIVATLLLAWDFLKWKQSGPKIKSRIVLNVHYDDGKVLSKEIISHGEEINYEEYCHIELVNIGNLPTTVVGISASHKKKKGSALTGVTQQAFTEHFGKKLPNIISPGEVWSCRLPMRHYHLLRKYGTPEIKVILSHLSAPLVIFASK